MQKLETISGTLQRILWQSPDERDGRRYAILALDQATTKGDIDPQTPLITGQRYSFHGRWERQDEARNGYPPSFRHQTYVESEPLNRTEIVTYLQAKLKGHGISYGIASRLFDAWQHDTVAILRNEPAKAASHPVVSRYLSIEKAQAAAETLRKIRATSEIEMKLMGLLSGKGFRRDTVHRCIKRWGIHAYRRVSHDPFAMLVAGFPSCGFMRCDHLYSELGCNPHRLKRQAICVWHAVHSDSSGSTWHPLDWASAILKSMIGGTAVRPNRAIKLAVRAGILDVRKDNGKWWIAESRKAADESSVVDCVVRLMGWTAAGDATISCDELDRHEFKGCDGSGVDPADVDDSDIAEMIRRGRATGLCYFCGRTLLTSESREAGYGPVCAERYGLPWGMAGSNGNGISGISGNNETEGSTENARCENATTGDQATKPQTIPA